MAYKKETADGQRTPSDSITRTVNGVKETIQPVPTEEVTAALNSSPSIGYKKPSHETGGLLSQLDKAAGFERDGHIGNITATRAKTLAENIRTLEAHASRLASGEAHSDVIKSLRDKGHPITDLSASPADIERRLDSAIRDAIRSAKGSNVLNIIKEAQKKIDTPERIAEREVREAEAAEWRKRLDRGEDNEAIMKDLEGRETKSGLGKKFNAMTDRVISKHNKWLSGKSDLSRTVITNGEILLGSVMIIHGALGLVRSFNTKEVKMDENGSHIELVPVPTATKVQRAATSTLVALGGAGLTALGFSGHNRR